MISVLYVDDEEALLEITGMYMELKGENSVRMEPWIGIKKDRLRPE